MVSLSTIFHRSGSSRFFFQGSVAWIRWLYAAGIVLLVVGMIWGLFFAPADRLQGESARIMFVHVPAAHLSQLVYLAIAAAGVVWLVWRMKLADICMTALAPIGCALTGLALASGAIWGIPTWGTGWVWDARLTSTLVLFFLYIGLIALRGALAGNQRAAMAVSILALVGAVNIPIIKYSVDWFATLHQPASITLGGPPAMAPAFLWPLAVNALGFHALVAGAALAAMRAELVQREARTDWVRSVLNVGPKQAP